MGRAEEQLPLALKRRLSMHRSFWNRVAEREGAPTQPDRVSAPQA
jgi:hypothetical protein